jgi:hypothetical protein
VFVLRNERRGFQIMSSGGNLTSSLIPNKPARDGGIMECSLANIGSEGSLKISGYLEKYVRAPPKENLLFSCPSTSILNPLPSGNLNPAKPPALLFSL